VNLKLRVSTLFLFLLGGACVISMSYVIFPSVLVTRPESTEELSFFSIYISSTQTTETFHFTRSYGCDCDELVCYYYGSPMEYEVCHCATWDTCSSYSRFDDTSTHKYVTTSSSIFKLTETRYTILKVQSPLNAWIDNNLQYVVWGVIALLGVLWACYSSQSEDQNES
jgi:hypothetical protein